MIDGLVSCIIPVYNRWEMLREAVQSVVEQTYSSWEILIVDDGSPEEPPGSVERLLESEPDKIRLLNQPNAGPGAARNTGVQHARGEFIQYLDSDDLLRPRKFELQVEALRRHPEAGVCYGVTLRGDPAIGDWRVWARTGEAIEHLFPDFLMKRGWATLTPLWRRITCEQIGSWAALRVLEDWEHDLRAGLLGIRPVRVETDEPLAVVRDHGGERASGMNTGFTGALTKDSFEAHRSIYQRMREQGRMDWEYLESFSRKVFWIARMCGQRDLIPEAEAALGMAREMVRTRRWSLQIDVFHALTRVLGWPAAVGLCEWARGLVSGRQGAGERFAATSPVQVSPGQRPGKSDR